MVRPSRIDMDEWFPGRYTANSLPSYGTRQSGKGPWKPRGRSNAAPQNAARWGSRPAERAERSYPNTIPVDRDSRHPASGPDNDTAPDIPERSNWMEEVAAQLIREATNEEQAAPGAGRQY